MRDGRASCAYMESVAMGENDKKTAIDPRTCPLRDFEGKTWGEIPPEGQTRIFCAYKDYFDTLDRRKRAIGYCVIMGGIAPRHIGIVDAIIQKDACGRRGFGLSIGGRICLMDDARLLDALDDYILNDPRFVEIADGIKSGGRAVAPLFVAAYNGRHDSLRDCVTFMCKAGKAIGYNARKIRLNHMTDNPIRVFPWRYDDPSRPIGFMGDMAAFQTGDNAICEMRGERQSKADTAPRNDAYIDRQRANTIANAIENRPEFQEMARALRELSSMEKQELMEYLKKIMQK